MRIAVDAMGGDHAPREIVCGAIEGLSHLDADDRLLLYGQEDLIRPELDALGPIDPRVEIVQCTQRIEMGDSPVEALRQKRDASIVRMAAAAGKGELDALISAGNTGAFVAASQLRIRTLPGVARPGIAVTMPTFHGPVLICDVGANVTPKPHHLYDYACMCRTYAREILDYEKPAIGLVSIGEEEGKGNQLVKEAAALIRADESLRFIGNVEGQDIFGGSGNVFICDGFVGNVVLKLTEGLAEGLFKTIVHEIAEEGPNLAKSFQPVVDRIWARHDFAEYGGAPLLGINSVVIICHGRSDRRAIRNAIRTATKQLRIGINDMLIAGREPRKEAET